MMLTLRVTLPIKPSKVSVYDRSMKHIKGRILLLSLAFAWAALSMTSTLRAQDITWGPTTGITGDDDLSHQWRLP